MNRIKAFFAGLPALFEQLKVRWPWLGRLLGMQEHYNARRGNMYAAAISFIGMLSLVPILMVSFAIAGFVLASRPELIQEITDAVIENVPGELGTQLNDIIDSAIDSRRAVGVVGLLSAALTGLGWMGLTRNGLSDMWGGRRKRNAVVGKLVDLGMFVGLGLLFAATIGLTVATTGPIGQWVLELLHIDDTMWGEALLRLASIVASICATWFLFSIVLSQMPVQKVPVRVVASAALAVAIIFEILKSLGAIYLKSVLSSPAAAAFGPILGVMVFAYLASRIVLYAAAWSASNPKNAEYLITDEVEFGDDPEPEPVYLAPVYEGSQKRAAGGLAAAAGIGAAVGAVLSWRRN
ncbi:YihY/virulence factor BrkB family protein [Gordonia sp. HY002]|uniref:YhjD/YihY/BrkB family envelope integrity protein n=1 Tax=Gordonia zhenghanii TaxID=2911516 RepID=UPI001EF1073A|nr:YhjD/YihY/BrkB family envelope integrity protein [Gordonia zhenghanii]MCF8570506.1 YihY/virulence factor BrkB family protein [Gordonia zhenghanii]MCF8602537.1 YihY/virulence factor BrkB family protein [Gordonia zhenghanii]